VIEGGKHWGKNFKSNPEVVGYRNNIERTTSYFITNFPTETTTSDLWRLFSKYWRVGEVYIPDKLDKAGKRFGFARFEDVNDRQKLLEKIENTWIGTYKIRANLPKFTRGEGVKKPAARVQEATSNRAESRQFGAGTSFKDTLLGGNKGKIDKLNNQNDNNNDKSKKQNGWVVKAKAKGRNKLTDAEYKAGVMAIDAEPKNLKMLDGSFVGTLKEIADVDSIQTNIWMEGFQQIKATPIGMDLILLNSSLEGEIQRAYESNKSWWEMWFLSLTPWRPNLRPRGRRIWVRPFGVPLHIWSWEGFKKIIWRYGTLVNLDPETLEQSRFDVARDLITVTFWEMVDEIIEVKVDDEVFTIRMIEERFGSLDLGRNKAAGSRNGVGDSDADSVSRVGEEQSVLGVAEGWSENESVGGDSVNYDDEGVLHAVDTVGINQGVVVKAVDTLPDGERENQCQEVGRLEAAKGYGAEEEDTDGDRIQTLEASFGSVCSVVMETPQPRVLNQVVEGQQLEMEQDVGEKLSVECVVEDVVGEGQRGFKVDIGPNLIMGLSEEGMTWVIEKEKK
jgi:hypothetical protein